MHHLGQDANIGDTVLKTVGHHVVVDAPTEVLGTGTCTEAPPAVLIGLLHQMSETVDVTVTEEVGHPLPLLGQKPRRGVVFPRVVDVDVLVADVVVTRKHQLRAFFPQFVDILAEEVEPHHLESLSFVARGARGVVDTHYRKVTKVGTEKAAFIVI